MAAPKKVRVITRDRGLRAFKRALDQADASGVSVGVHEDAGAHEGTGLTMAELAAVHEFGLGNVPERSFLRSWGTERGVRMVVERAPMVEADLKAGRALQTLHKLGMLAVGEIQKRMAKGTPPPLAPATLRAKTKNGKTGDIPLIDTGALRQSITHKVFDR